MHYTRFRIHGDVLAGAKVKVGEKCKIEGCHIKPIAKDLCAKHYAHSRGTKPRIKKSETCAVINCICKPIVKDWCGMHYQRWKRFGDATFHPITVKRICTISDCERVANARGLCSSHYYRWQKYGDAQGNSKIRVSPVLKQLAKRQCKTCGSWFEPGTSRARKYCGRRCKPWRVSGSVNKRNWVDKLGNEDGWHCWLCNKPIDRNLYWPHALAGSVDHVIPASKMGTDERHNLKLAHLHCNTTRRDNPPPNKALKT